MTQEDGHKPRIAMLGMGTMGAPMARNLLAAGFPLRAWNRTFEKALFTDALADLPIGSPYGVAKANAMIAREFEPGFALRHALEDVILALDEVAGRELELPLLELINARWSDAVRQGHGDQDLSAAVTTLR